MSDEMTKAEVDAMLGADYLHAREQADYWTKRKDEFKAKLTAAAGDAEELTIDGVPRFTYKTTRKFKTAEFIKDNPDLADVFSVVVETEELDLPKLKRLQPALYSRYLTRSLLVVE